MGRQNHNSGRRIKVEYSEGLKYVQNESQRREFTVCYGNQGRFREEEKANQSLKDSKGLSRCVVRRVRGIMTWANSTAEEILINAMM